MIERLLPLLATSLDPQEREAVLGDLAESGETDHQAVSQLLGLLARRQAAHARTPRFWITFALALTLAALLALASSRTADGTAIYLWLYSNNSDPYLLRNAGFWYGLAHTIPDVFLSYIVLACWSWAAGLLLGLLSRRSLGLHTATLVLLLLGAGVVPPPRPLDHVLLLERARDFAGNARVFDHPFYRLLFPWIVATVCVLVPAVLGLRHATRFRHAAPLLRAVLALAALLSVSTLLAQNSAWWQTQVGAFFPLSSPTLHYLLPVALLALGPAAYLLPRPKNRHQPCSTQPCP